MYGRLGVTQSVFGTPAYWLVHALNIATGRLDEEGGVMFATPAFDLPVIGARTTDLIGYDRWRSRVRGIPEFSAELPVATLADEILTPGDGQVRALVLYAGNPVLSAPDGSRLEAALEDLELCVAVDYYITESTRHADVILPPTSPLERDEFDVVFPAVSVHNWVRWSPAAVPAPEGSMSDADILLALLARVWRRTPKTRRTASAREKVFRGLFPKRFVDLGLRAGPYGARKGRAGLTLAKVMRAEHGLDLGPLVRQLPQRLMTERASGSRPRAPAVLLADWPRVLAGPERRSRPGVRTRSRPAHGRPTAPAEQQLLDAQQRAAHQGADAVHRADAPGRRRGARPRGRRHGGREHRRRQHRGAGRGDRPAHARRGQRAARLRPRPGGRTPTGWRRHAAALGGASVNDITDTDRIDPLSGNAAVQAVPVTVARASGA